MDYTACKVKQHHKKGGDTLNLFLRNFPEDLHMEIKLQAVRERKTLKDFVIMVLELYMETLKKKEKKT
jgi:hypothetical protein